jgi:hypothetical protein
MIDNQRFYFYALNFGIFSVTPQYYTVQGPRETLLELEWPNQVVSVHFTIAHPKLN